MRYAFQDQHKCYLVTEFVSGGDLGYYLNVKKKQFSQEQAKFIMANLILSIEFLHVNGVIYKDVRPENFVFESNGYLKMIDFGLARIYQSNNSSDTSGTPGYMAPEVLLRQNYGYISDFFGLGVILHQIMLKSKPYSATS